MVATQSALIRLERWSEYWYLPLNPSKCEGSSFSVDPLQGNLQPNLLLLNFRFNSTPTFPGITFDHTLSFSKHVSSLKAEFFPCLKALRCTSVRLSLTLTLSPLIIWCSGLTAQSLLAKAALAYLPTALFVALFSFQQAQYAQVSLLKPAPFCRLFTGLGNTNNFAISLLLTSYLTLVLSSPPYPFLHLFFYLNLSGTSGRNYLLSPPILSGYNGSPDTRFSRGTKRLMSWPDGERYLRPLQSFVVSLLLSLVLMEGLSPSERKD